MLNWENNMGIGFFYNGCFHLNVSLQYTPKDDEIAFLNEFFNKTSQILYDVTDGQHRIGTVFISTDSSGRDSADILIWPCYAWAPRDMSPQGYPPDSIGANLWLRSQSMDYNQESLMYPSIMAHELGHYLYDIFDEYDSGRTNSGCQNDITTEACLMELNGYQKKNYSRWERAQSTPQGDKLYRTFDIFWPDYTNTSSNLVTYQDGQPTEFCCKKNHQLNGRTSSNPNRLKPCWTYAATDGFHNGIPYGLQPPNDADLPNKTPPSQMPPTIVQKVLPETRYELVLDRSGSMVGSKISQLKVGANFWIDYVNSKENLGIVSYSKTANLDLPLSIVPDDEGQATTWRNNNHLTVDALTPDTTTAIGDALRMAYVDIISQQLAATQIIILFTDGLQNDGAEKAEDVITDLVSAGIRVYTIGFGNDQDSVLLGNIADTTGGAYFKIPEEIDTDAAAQAISEALIQVAGESRPNSAINAFREIKLNNTGTFEEENVPFSWAPPNIEIKPLKEVTSFSFPVTISNGSSHATLGALWKNRKLTFDVKVTDPTGTIITQSPKVRLIKGKYPYSFYEIDDPTPGKWIVEIIGENIFSTYFRSIGFEVNKYLRFKVNALKPHVKTTEKIQLRARVLFQAMSAPAILVADVYSPAGTWSKITFLRGDTKKGQLRSMYYAEIETEFPGEYLIWTKASFNEPNFNHNYKAYKLKTKIKEVQAFTQFKMPRLERTEFLSARADSAGLMDDALIIGYNKKGPLLKIEK
jgi:hypothetical protein